jgi:hypothetical protein
MNYPQIDYFFKLFINFIFMCMKETTYIAKAIHVTQVKCNVEQWKEWIHKLELKQIQSKILGNPFCVKTVDGVTACTVHRDEKKGVTKKYIHVVQWCLEPQNGVKYDLPKLILQQGSSRVSLAICDFLKEEEHNLIQYNLNCRSYCLNITTYEYDNQIWIHSIMTSPLSLWLP